MKSAQNESTGSGTHLAFDNPCLAGLTEINSPSDAQTH